MRLFTQIFLGKVRKWFKSLPTARIRELAMFETYFITRWGDKKNPLHLLTQKNNMKKVLEEMVQEFLVCFMKVYNLILVEFQPPPRVVQFRCTDSFNNDFTLLLREIISANLDAIMRNAIKVEVTMMVSGKIK
jgi:hypothetical protein